MVKQNPSQPQYPERVTRLSGGKCYLVRHTKLEKKKFCGFFCFIRFCFPDLVGGVFEDCILQNPAFELKKNYVSILIPLLTNLAMPGKLCNIYISKVVYINIY